MPRVLTLAHLSDVHLAPLPALALRHWNVKRGLGYLNWKRSRIDVHQRTVLDKITTDLRTQAPDHIAVTGDIANLGLPAEYAAGRAWLEELGSPSNVSVVPGNHDIYSGQMFGASCLTAWAPYMKGEASGAIDDGYRGQTRPSRDEDILLVRAFVGVNNNIITGCLICG